ncbi:MAG: excinuclease ABC subunit UvrC [Bdellovibrionota bacterium]
MENQASKPIISRSALFDQVQEAPVSPGVYLMKGLGGEIIYIGKAKNLRNRLSTYFQSCDSFGDSNKHSARIEMLVCNIASFDVILTETEAEALILECTLIKKHKPKFNIRLKDDKAYPYLKIQVNDRFPRIEWTRRTPKDGARYFGPFPSSWVARQVMKLLNETFKLRDCSDNTFRHRSRPCILNQMGMCSGPCVGLVNESMYRESIQGVVDALGGKIEPLICSLKKGMEDASSRQEYEKAAEYRDQIRNLELITETQGVTEAGSQRNRDVAGLARLGPDAHGTILKIRCGKLVSVQHFELKNSHEELTDAEVMFEFLAQYYLLKSGRGSKEDVQEMDSGGHAQELLLPFLPEDLDLFERVSGISPMMAENEVDMQLLSVAKANASYAIEQSAARRKDSGADALDEVQRKLGLACLPCRIECYDISNIQGCDAVASRVVFLDGAPAKDLYRRYKIKTVDGANDYLMMREVLLRRFKPDQSENLPDLIVVDGGKGQLSQAVAILDELEIQHIGVAALAKARVERDFKATEVKSSIERIFIPNRKNHIPLYPHTAIYRLLIHIRDEAHRFALNYHRLLRDKRAVNS